jgi:inorganic phosphate transporter, PiT family
VLARGLLESFSGRGLVPDAVAATGDFAFAVMFAAAATVLLATRLGFPISTTHALVGGLVGAGWAASPQGVHFGQLGGAFVLPLLFSPVLSLGMAAAFYPGVSRMRRRLGVRRETCLCAGIEAVGVRLEAGAGALARTHESSLPSLSIGSSTACEERYQGRVMGVTAQALVDFVHYLSAGAVSFARGLNDTPKIAALLLTTGALGATGSVLVVGALMAVGGWLNARRVAETMSHRVTDMNPGQGLVGNLVTAGLVILASRLGMPVSTTHVSLGAIFGIGAVTGQARWKVIGTILLAWVTTLPLAALLGATGYSALRAFGG